MVSYQPGWKGQDFKVIALEDENNQLKLSVSIKYFNGQYFSPQQLSSQSALTQTYSGFSALPNWVLSVAIVVPVLFLTIVLALGLGFGVQIVRTRKFQDKKVNQTCRKIENLNSAVDGVYKNIISKKPVAEKKSKTAKSLTKPSTNLKDVKT